MQPSYPTKALPPFNLLLRAHSRYPRTSCKCGPLHSHPTIFLTTTGSYTRSLRFLFDLLSYIVLVPFAFSIWPHFFWTLPCLVRQRPRVLPDDRALFVFASLFPAQQRSQASFRLQTPKGRSIISLSQLSASPLSPTVIRWLGRPFSIRFFLWTAGSNCFSGAIPDQQHAPSSSVAISRLGQGSLEAFIGLPAQYSSYGGQQARPLPSLPV